MIKRRKLKNGKHISISVEPIKHILDRHIFTRQAMCPNPIPIEHCSELSINDSQYIIINDALHNLILSI